MSKILILIFVLLTGRLQAQQKGIDSLKQRFSTEAIDSNRVKLLWNLASQYQVYKPDTALILANEALSISRKIGYLDGESKSLNQIANAFNRVGNYTKALEYYIEKLKIDEKRNDLRNLAIAYTNLATAYSLQGEFRLGLNYAFMADSLIVARKIKDLRFYNLLNIGDMYEKFNKLDSALQFTNRAYNVAVKLRDDNLIGASLTNMGNICLKNGSTELAVFNYRRGLPYLVRTNDEEFICENTIGLARAFRKQNNQDSALYYARKSFHLAQKDGFLSRQLDAGTFLKDHFKEKNNIDSAFKYQEQLLIIRDTLNSAQRIREAQIISLDEQLRQKELNDLKIKDREETNKRMQLLALGVMVPISFLVFMYFKRQMVKPKIVEILGVVSLLLFFECITLLLHPVVLEMTNHIPILELLVFAIIATALSRTHHRLEKWVMQHLTYKKHEVKQDVTVKNFD